MNAESIKLLKASPGDYKDIVALLSSQQLPAEDIDKTLPHFFVVKEGGRIVAVIGLEIFGSLGLLRSMATDPAYRNRGLATMLVLEVINYAKQKDVREIFLLTESADTYFSKRGFHKISRKDVPTAIKESSEFSHICPSSAILMKKEIV